ncbi:G2/mitotic-specific cyclin-B-like [Zophobas morio]|jgi:hypothetical protein|uniref:G2/mitotic-specific cyclin-B-like n=1 Tax=Zophobas morio TaxID=2755281 RepID=UPI003083DCDE
MISHSQIFKDPALPAGKVDDLEISQNTKAYKRAGLTTGTGLRDVSNLYQLPVVSEKQNTKEKGASVYDLCFTKDHENLKKDILSNHFESKGAFDPMEVDDEKRPKDEQFNIINIDKLDKDFPEFCAEYAPLIYDYLHVVQRKHAVSHEYMKKQTDISPKMRAILIDWLIDVHLRFKLTQETLYLTVSIIDRFLSLTIITRDKLQLVGVTAMLIGSKFEEIYAPEVNDFVYITDDAYTRNQILEMERTILNTLNFQIATAYPLHFLRRASKVADADPLTHTMAKYLMELTLPYTDSLRFLPSMIAASALCLARMMLHSGGWSPTIEYYTKHSEESLNDCVHELFALAKDAKKSQFKAIHKKYGSGRFHNVSHLADSQIANVRYVN